MTRPEHRRPRSRKARRRERREAIRHGFDDLASYRLWVHQQTGTGGWRRRQAWLARRRGGDRE